MHIPVEEARSLPTPRLGLNIYSAGAVRIEYQTDRADHVTLEVFNAAGRNVRTLVNAVTNAGVHSVTWDAKAFPSGIYFFRLNAGGAVMARSGLVIR
jgi:hypothetical protein